MKLTKTVKKIFVGKTKSIFFLFFFCFLVSWGIGEMCWGGYGQILRAKPEMLVEIPPNITPLQCMTIGTAGLTSALCILSNKTFFPPNT